MNDRLGEARLSHMGDGPVQVRLWPLVVLVLGIFLLFVFRLFQLQILEGEDLASRSQANSVRTVRLEAQRGTIVDREGRVLAATRPAHGVDLMPNDLRNRWRTYSVLGAVLDMDPEVIEERVGSPRGRRRFQPISLSKDLQPRERAQIAGHRYAMPGVELYQKPLREYVYGSMAAQLFGTIGEIGVSELQSAEFAGYRQGETIGKTGIEATHEAHLRGRAGGANVIVDVAGREIDEIGRREPTPGGRLVLTLDLDLQLAAEKAFLLPPSEKKQAPPENTDPVAAEEAPTSLMGSIVALDVHTGDVLALVSAPHYDANAFAGGVDRETWRALNNDIWRPLRNRAIAGVYPPGSTYKAFVAAAGLAEEIVTATTTTTCPGYYRLGRRVYRCWKRGGHGKVDLGEALKGSCDVYFYELGRSLGVETLARYARLFGLGAPTGIAMAGETGGLVPTPAWKQRVKGEPWVEGETISLSIGQGANLVTPIQLAVAYATIANGGSVIEPRIVLREETWDGELVSATRPKIRDTNVIAPAILEMVTEGLQRVVMEQGGTGRRARVPGIAVAGKSGTTQVVSLDLVEDLEPEEIPLKYRDHALFAAFAPADAPEIVVVAVAEHAGGGGGKVAAPMVQKVLARYFEKQQGEVLSDVAMGESPSEVFEDGSGTGALRVSALPSVGAAWPEGGIR